MKRAAVLLVILALGACSQAPNPEAGELRVIPLSGEVSLLDGGETSSLEEATTVQAGLGLQTGSDGRAEVQFPGGSSIELGPGALLQLDDTEPEVSQGKVLVRTGADDVSVQAGAAHIEATDDSVFRVDRQTSVELGVYRGQASIPGAGVDVPALRQTTVLQNGSAAGYAPLLVSKNDPWDIRFLGEAIDVGVRLISLERGLTRQLPRGEEARAVADVLGSEFSAAAVKAAIRELGDAARAVVAAVIAREAVRIDGGSLARVFSEVVNLQAIADNWIVIVAQWGLAAASERLLDQLGELVVVAAESVAPPEAPSSASSSSSASGPSGTGPTSGGDVEGPTGGGSGGPRPGPGPKGGPPSEGGNPPPAPPEEPPGGEEPVQSCDDNVECAVEDIIPGRRLPDLS